MDTPLTDTHFFINVELGHHLPEFTIKLSEEKRLITWERNKFENEQKYFRFLPIIITLVSSAKNTGSDTEFVIRVVIVRSGWIVNSGSLKKIGELEKIESFAVLRRNLISEDVFDRFERNAGKELPPHAN